MITLRLTPTQAAALLHQTDCQIQATRESLAVLTRFTDPAWDLPAGALAAALESLQELRETVRAAVVAWEALHGEAMR